MQELPLDKAYGGFFTQPFLSLSFVDGSRWHVDVGGDLDPYLIGYSRIRTLYECLSDEEKFKKGMFAIFGDGVNWLSRATPLLIQLVKRLAEINPYYTVKSVCSYTGSAGPSFILRQGAFFKRFDLSPSIPLSTSVQFYGQDVNEYLLKSGLLDEKDK